MSPTATMTSVRVDLYPAPPPTKNTLDREERSRLLRSTRKLGAVLGTTPKVVEPEVLSPAPAFAYPDTRTAGSRAGRREGRIYHSRSSSTSSDATLAPEPEPGYVYVRGNVRSAPYQVQAVFDNASPSSSRSSSRSASPHPTSGPVTRNLKRKQGQDPTSLAPMTVAFPIPGSAAGSKQTRSGPSDASPVKERAVTGGVHPSQPLLLRLRAVPVLPDESRAINEDDLRHDSRSKPLSPVTSTFNMSVDIIPSSPTLPLHSAALSDREKRRKMAKLTRTLGENIPPELVFRSAPISSSSNSSTAAGPSNLARHSSLSFGRSLHRPHLTTTTFDPLAPFHNPTKFSNSSKANTPSALPPLPVAAVPVPVPVPSQPQARPEPSSQATKKSRHRPRSLTLGTSSAFAAATAALLQKDRTEPTRGTTSLDIRPAPPHAAKLARNNSARPPASPKPFGELPRVQERRSGEEHSSADNGLLGAEFGRRKEREWSGEWNVKDMDDVAKKLRGLKGR